MKISYVQSCNFNFQRIYKCFFFCRYCRQISYLQGIIIAPETLNNLSILFQAFIKLSEEVPHKEKCIRKEINSTCGLLI